ncbi:MAG: hypothetical protein CM15mP49_14810 [Actinomycetota bacterium]|nr:MAG: hypothetical protein CM15mP49_14810 [Actinomycetota bacterium]
MIGDGALTGVWHLRGSITLDILEVTPSLFSMTTAGPMLQRFLFSQIA